MATTRANHLRVLAALALAAAPAASLLILVAVTKPAQAAFPGKNGKIAFVKENFRGSGIFTMNPDGSEQRKIGSGY